MLSCDEFVFVPNINDGVDELLPAAAVVKQGKEFAEILISSAFPSSTFVLLAVKLFSKAVLPNDGNAPGTLSETTPFVPKFIFDAELELPFPFTSEVLNKSLVLGIVVSLFVRELNEGKGFVKSIPLLPPCISKPSNDFGAEDDGKASDLG